MKLPKSWSEVSVEQWQELNGVSNEDKFNELLDKVAILLDLDRDDEYFDSLYIEDLIAMLSEVSWINREPPSNIPNEVDNFKLINIGRLTLGEFIDIEHWIVEPIKNIHLIASVLIRGWRINDWSHLEIEPYTFDIYDRGNIFLEKPINKVWGVYKLYMDFRKQFMDDYSTLFEDPDYDVIEDEDKLSPEELKEIKEEIEKDKKLAKFSWTRLIWDLSGGDITKMDEITNQPIKWVFNNLSMKKSLEL